uniref:Sodium channel and clathrin linker 1-like n=1 Tax=Saccoglossus kowalevskii TaxID=10224 RepID=A0ABM0MPM8_SACKO
MAAGEVDFLRDQVHRLNVILSQYQEKYLTLDEDDKREFWDLQTKVDHLVGENRRLHEDLRSSVESRLRETQPLSANEVDQLNEENVLHNLQQQVQLITQERDSAKEMLASNIKELDKVRHDLQEARNEAQFKAANYQLIQERSSQVLTQNQKLLSDNQKLEVATQHFQTTLNAQSAEVDQLRDHLQQSRAEHRAVNLQLHEMKKVLDQLKQEMMRKDGETSQAVGREYAADSRLTQLQASLMEMENQISNLHFENKKLQSENKELEEKFNILQTKGGDAEKREYDATMQVRESVQLVENAILEKDQAVIREQQKSQELHRLQEALSKLINEAGLRTKQEVEHVRKQCNNNIAKLMEEIQALEM